MKVPQSFLEQIELSRRQAEVIVDILPLIPCSKGCLKVVQGQVVVILALVIIGLSQDIIGFCNPAARRI